MDDLKAVGTGAVMSDKSEVDWNCTTPLRLIQQELSVIIRGLSDQGKRTVGASLRVLDVRGGASVALLNVVRSQEMQRQVHIPLAHDLQSDAREGGHRC